MLRGRHRGLPVAIDKAVLLPSETLAWAEEEDAQRKREAGQGISGDLRRRVTGLEPYDNSANGTAQANGNVGVSGGGSDPNSAEEDVGKLV